MHVYLRCAAAVSRSRFAPNLFVLSCPIWRAALAPPPPICIHSLANRFQMLGEACIGEFWVKVMSNTTRAMHWTTVVHSGAMRAM